MPASLFLFLVTQKAEELKRKRRKKKAKGVACMYKPLALYKELESRSKRCHELERVSSKLKTRQDLMVRLPFWNLAINQMTLAR